MASLKAGCGKAMRGLWHKINRKKTVSSDSMSTDMKRCLGTGDLISFGLGHMMGSGIYVVTGTVLVNVAGPSVSVSYFLAGLAAILISQCYAQFSVNLPRTGTVYTYVSVVGGELLAFLAGWNLLLDYLISTASVGRALSDYVNELSGGAIKNGTMTFLGVDPAASADDQLATRIVGNIDFFGPAVILAVHIVVAVGVRSTANFNHVMISVSVLVLLTIVVAGLVVGDTANLTAGGGGFFPFGVQGTLKASGVLFYSYIGFDAIAVASEETKNPSRSLPIALPVAIVVAIVLYSSASFALTLMAPYGDIAPDAPFPSAFELHGMKWVSIVVSVGAIFGLSCSVLGQSYCLPRGIYAMASDGLLFSQLTYVHAWTQTPLVAVGASAFLSALMAMLLPIADLVQMVAIGILFAMGLMVLCLLKVHYLPAQRCPFELLPRPEHQEPPPIPPYGNKTDKEDQPILPKEKKSNKGQNLADIGKLKYQVPVLTDKDPDMVITVTLGVLTCALLGMAVCLIVCWEQLLRGQWAVVLALTLTTILFILSFSVLLMYEANRSFSKFKVPLAPWIPVLTLFIILVMLVGLEPITWLRLVVWLVIGLLIYFAYGMWHSTVGREGYAEIELNDDPLRPPEAP